MLREIDRNRDLKSVGLAQTVAWPLFRADYMKHLKTEGCAPSTLVRVEIILRHLERLFPITNLMDITPRLLDDFKSARRDEEIDPATINRELSAIKAAVRQGKRWQFQVHDLSDVSKVKVPEKVSVSFTHEELKTMIEKADPLFRMFILMGLYAGLRREEMLQLRWTNVNWDRKTLILGDGWKTKTGRIRVLPLHPKLEAALISWKAVCGASERVVQWDRAPHQLSGMFTHFLRKRCGIARGSLHSLRHTFVTALKRKDVSGAKVQKLAGHASARTTEIYTHLDVRDLEEGVSRLNFDEPEDVG
jgi:integrase